APRSDWIAQLIKPLKAGPDIAGCKGVYATRQKEVVARFVQVEYEDKYDRLRRPARIDFIDTYSAAYRRQVLLDNGGFDERIFFVEDQELSFRLASRGYHMVFQPAAVVYHHHSDSLTGYFRKKFMIGYWKAQIIRRFPGRAIKDSHTPQVLKVQILLVALALWAAAVAVVLPVFSLFLAGILLIYFLTTIPFLRKAWPKDRVVTVVAPFLLGIRAVALGAGYAWGMMRPQPGVGSEATASEGDAGSSRSLWRDIAIVASAIVAVVRGTGDSSEQ
ncbi:MAG TPA: glycosyltransferase, partial [Anaerolineae bacterium]